MQCTLKSDFELCSIQLNRILNYAVQLQTRFRANSNLILIFELQKNKIWFSTIAVNIKILFWIVQFTSKSDTINVYNEHSSLTPRERQHLIKCPLNGQRWESFSKWSTYLQLVINLGYTYYHVYMRAAVYSVLYMSYIYNVHTMSPRSANMGNVFILPPFTFQD